LLTSSETSPISFLTSISPLLSLCSFLLFFLFFLQAKKNVPYTEKIAFTKRLTVEDLPPPMVDTFFDVGFSRNEMVEHSNELFFLFMWLYGPSQVGGKDDTPSSNSHARSLSSLSFSLLHLSPFHSPSLSSYQKSTTSLEKQQLFG
jgi:hypothetical protein